MRWMILLACFSSPLIAHAIEPARAKPAEANAIAATHEVKDPAALPDPPSSLVTTTPRPRRITTSSSVIVKATAPPLSPTSHLITSSMIETAAGAFEDPSRYFQLLPGVVSDSDQRNDFLVRGGNPSENLFVVDNIDIHSINHLALSDTTGGFVSMIDNAAIQSMTLHTAEHDAKFDDRLSSVVEISTIPDHAPGAQPAIRHMAEAGIAGVGGMDSRPLGNNGSLFISGRQGILNLVTNDIGMNGVPKYTNNLIRADNTLANGDRIWGLSLTGIDSITITPDRNDAAETNPLTIDYSGWRNTTGGNYQHLFSPRSYGVVTLSNSEQAQTIGMDSQLDLGYPIYNEKTHDGDTTLKTEYASQVTPLLILSGGLNETLHRIDYNIVQPDGVPNPYSSDPAPASAVNVHRSFSTPDDGGYGQAVFILPANLRLSVGARAHRWAIDHRFALTPKASLAIPLGGFRFLSVGIADYAQLPSYLYMLAFQQSTSLAPIHARHLTVALTLLNRDRVRVTLAAYRKTYRDYPVSTEFPQLSLANIADTFGNAFLMFPMASLGLGRSAGAELSVDVHATSRVTLTGNLAYARSWYSGLDGVLRKGSYDLPVVGNVAAVIRVGKGITASFRYSGTSGRPYTPDDLTESYRQDRDVYDLTRINGLRSSMYGRLDFRIEKATAFRGGTLLWHVGLDNALNRQNFYAYLWQPWIGGVAQQSQMPRFPDGGVKYLF